MKDGVTLFNMRKESISEALTFRSSLDQSSNIQHIEVGWYLAINKYNYIKHK